MPCFENYEKFIETAKNRYTYEENMAKLFDEEVDQDDFHSSSLEKLIWGNMAFQELKRLQLEWQ